MESKITKIALCIYHNSKLYKFYTWTSPYYFYQQTFLCIKYKNSFLYTPILPLNIVQSELLKIYAFNIRFSSYSILYSFLYSAYDLTATMLSDHINYGAQIVTYGKTKIGAAAISFWTSTCQRIGMRYKYKVSVVKGCNLINAAPQAELVNSKETASLIGGKYNYSISGSTTKSSLGTLIIKITVETRNDLSVFISFDFDSKKYSFVSSDALLLG